jgi:hypothetical protein
MRSLFEKEEKETAINQLKIDLISRFYTFTKDEILKYKSVLNFGYYHFMSNDLIQWDNDLLDVLEDKIDWTALWKIRDVTLDFAFFKKHEHRIEFGSVHLSKSIEWSDYILAEYGDRFDWSGFLITRKPLATIENLRRFKDDLNWNWVSRRINIEFTEALLEEFSDKWDWYALSSNPHLPISVQFIQKHIDQLDFVPLSRNPKSLELIYKYPKSERWNWDSVICNTGIVYDDTSFKFMFEHFKENYEKRANPNSERRVPALPAFLLRVFRNQLVDISYFLQDKFMKRIPFNWMCKHRLAKFSLEVIESNKKEIDFKNSEFLGNHRGLFTSEFLSSNLDLFDPSQYSFYNLPLTFDILSKLDDKVNWNHLSSCKTLDWSWELIDTKFDKFNVFKLSENKGIYEKLIGYTWSKRDIVVFLDSQLVKN